jgi:hypothetical protein
MPPTLFQPVVRDLTNTVTVKSGQRLTLAFTLAYNKYEFEATGLELAVTIPGKLPPPPAFVSLGQSRHTSDIYTTSMDVVLAEIPYASNNLILVCLNLFVCVSTTVTKLNYDQSTSYVALEQNNPRVQRFPGMPGIYVVDLIVLAHDVSQKPLEFAVVARWEGYRSGEADELNRLKVSDLESEEDDSLWNQDILEVLRAEADNESDEYGASFYKDNEWYLDYVEEDHSR